ncbi:MAG: UDP-glucose/GDP-mannose dehydrogenase family protein [Verrucomicrobia bacterium]|nr:UDP-glucose/GDP-mannose dehydrogenase family protein [Verrucomicrobiota bacterium]
MGKRVGIIGVGYVGLVTGTCLAEIGHHVHGIDSNTEKIDMLHRGEVPIYEPGLAELIKKNMAEGRLVFGTDTAECVKHSDIIFICVNTPPKDNGQADLRYVELAARHIAEAMDGYKILVDKSTVPVHTGAKVRETVKRYNKGGIEFDIVSNPEFLREGSAVADALKPDRIVVGVTSKRAAETMRELYEPFGAPIIVTDIESAEIIKHACNSFLAMKISFINSIASICEAAGANIDKVVEGMALDARIGGRFLQAGIGYGGSCFPKDVSAFIHISQELGYDFEILKAVEKVNAAQRTRFIKKIEETLWVVGGKTIGVLGLAFKPNTDDMRNAPSIDIIQALLKEGAKIRAYDPVAMPNSEKLLEGVEFCKGSYEVADGADALVIITEWDEFQTLDLERVRTLLNQPIIIDGRNVFDPAKMDELGFIYKSVGR